MNVSFVQAAPFLWLLLAVTLEIAGTSLLKLSDGMTRRITGAGGVVTNWEGGPAQSGGRIIAAGDPRVHEAAMKLLNSQGIVGSD